MKNSLNISSKGGEYKSWSKSVTKDEITKTVRVEECENGFYICISEYGDKNGKYYDESKKYISTKNPLEGQMEVDKDKEIKNEIMESIKAMDL